MMCHIQWHVGWYVAAYVSWHVTGDLNKWIFLKQSYFKYLEFCNLVPKFLNTFFPFPPFLRVSNPLHIPSNHSLGFIRICQPTSLQPDILILGTFLTAYLYQLPRRLKLFEGCSAYQWRFSNSRHPLLQGPLTTPNAIFVMHYSPFHYISTMNSTMNISFN